MLTISDRSRWQKLKHILADALEQPLEQGRAETLWQACGDDPALLRDAEALLNQDTTSLEDFAEFARTWLRDESKQIPAPGWFLPTRPKRNPNPTTRSQTRDT